MRKTDTSIALVAAVVMATAAFACSEPRPQDPRGGAEVRMYAISAGDVASVTVTVTGPGIAAPIVVNLTQSGDQWLANLSEIPAGSDRTFTLSARNADGVEVYAGVATGVTIVAGQTAAVSISGQETSPAAPVSNRSPVIDALVGSTTLVAQGGTITLSVSAHDDDSGDLITFLWTASAGTLDTPAQASTTWMAPESDGSYRVTVQVQDSHGATASMYVDLTVGGGTSSEATISVSLNKWPVVAGISSTKGRIDVNESAKLDVAASDADNDVLTYAWRVADGCAGTFDDATAKSPTFTLGDTLPAEGQCQLAVTVSDGRGGTNSGSLAVTAAPPPAVNLAPRIVSAVQSLQRASSGQSVTMAVQAEDPEGSVVTFAWTVSGGTLGTATPSEGASQMVWTAPNPFTGEVYVRCTVSDASGVSTVKNFTIYVAAASIPTQTSTSTDTGTTVDVTPATLSALAVSPATADTSSAPATVAVSFTVADELSGIKQVSVRYASPSGSQSAVCSIPAPADQPAPMTFSSSCNLQLAQHSEAGTWSPSALTITDAAGNVSNLGAADLAGFVATLTVMAATVDTDPPALAAFAFTPTSVDVATGTVSVTVTATITDNLSGLSQAGFMFADPSGTQEQACWINRPAGASGLRLYNSSCSVEIPQHSLAGAWKVSQVYLSDEASNAIRLTTAEVAALGFPVDLTVASDGDVTGPAVVGFSLTPATANTSAGSVTVTASFTITDDLSGLWDAGVKLTSPSGAQSQICRIYPPTGQSPTSYAASCTVVIPRYSEVGTWNVEWVYASDDVGNLTVLGAAELAAGGFSSGISVTSGQ